MREQDFEDMSANVYEPPKWLDDALREVFDDGHGTAIEFSQPSEAFRERCREAANVALSMARLRNERRRIGLFQSRWLSISRDSSKSLAFRSMLCWRDLELTISGI